MKKFLNALLDSSNRQVEAHLFLLCLGSLIFMALSAYHVVVLRQAFDPDPYGRGLGELLAGSGAAAWGQGMQRKAENEGGVDEPHQ